MTSPRFSASSLANGELATHVLTGRRASGGHRLAPAPHSVRPYKHTTRATGEATPTNSPRARATRARAPSNTTGPARSGLALTHNQLEYVAFGRIYPRLAAFHACYPLFWLEYTVCVGIEGVFESFPWVWVG